MKKDILDILHWHEDSTGVIQENKYESVANDIIDLFKIENDELTHYVNTLNQQIDFMRDEIKHLESGYNQGHNNE